MGRTGGEKTKSTILKAAEKLFAEKGFDGTGVEDIANEAGVNKALLYYHFKNKEGILETLFEMLSSEICKHISTEMGECHQNEDCNHEKEIEIIVAFLEKHRTVLAILLMESLKNGERSSSLFKGAELIFGNKEKGIIKHSGPKQGNMKLSEKQLMLDEFFTGFMPLVTFVVYKEKWGKYFGYPKGEIVKDFTNLFVSSHIHRRGTAPF
jgi:AcrR family transcriptional regulator